MSSKLAELKGVAFSRPSFFDYLKCHVSQSGYPGLNLFGAAIQKNRFSRLVPVLKRWKRWRCILLWREREETIWPIVVLAGDNVVFLMNTVVGFKIRARSCPLPLSLWWWTSGGLTVSVGWPLHGRPPQLSSRAWCSTVLRSWQIGAKGLGAVEMPTKGLQKTTTPWLWDTVYCRGLKTQC